MKGSWSEASAHFRALIEDRLVGSGASIQQVADFPACMPGKTPAAKVGGKLPIKLPKLRKEEPGIFTVKQIERLSATACTKLEIDVDAQDGARVRCRFTAVS
jgi:hypothetical protein